MITTILLSILFVGAIWIPAKVNAPIILFSALYGFSSGAFVSMISALVAQISDIREMGIRNGTNFFIISFAALTGNPIAGVLIDRNNGGYLYLQIFTGLSMIIGLLFYIASRYAQVEWKWAKV